MGKFREDLFYPLPDHRTTFMDDMGYAYQDVRHWNLEKYIPFSSLANV